MSHRTLRSFVFILLAVGAISIANADTWLLPTKEKYYSPNKKYYVEITPKKLESQLKYFQDKVNGADNAGTAKGEKENRAKAAFYVRRADGGYAKKKQFPLANEVAPISAIVSNKGDYVVTFDNWHAVGYGDDVVLI